MKGFNTVRQGESIHTSGNTSCTYELKVKDSGTEAMLMSLKRNSMLICQPYECRNSLNIYYILDGVLEHQRDKSLYKKGDCFTVKNIQDSIFFKCIVDSSILWITEKNIYEQVAFENRLINQMLQSIQQKDNYTYDHCCRVGQLSRQISRKMGLSDKRIVNTIIAAMCHDIGKINTPVQILNKPDSLSETEYEIVKRHAIDGYVILAKEMGEDIARIILQHHERLDGRGYPNHIRGNDIILEAKILAVIDSFDAMVSDRPYRRGIKPEEALSELKGCIGTHYEKEVVDRFEEVLIEEDIIHIDGIGA
ncbi:MAG: HD-GYP domain-containing protein [Bacillota bacterium]